MVVSFLKVMVKEIISKDMSLFPNEDILTKEIESWKSFGDSLSSKEDRELLNDRLNDYYKCALLQLTQRRTVDHGLIAFTT